MDQTANPGMPIVPAIIALAIAVLLFGSLWKIFTKAGQPGWAALVPIYQLIVLFKVAGKPAWWVIFMFVPIASLVVHVLVNLGVARAFGKSAGYGIGLALLPIIFVPMLAFGSATYQGAPTAG